MINNSQDKLKSLTLDQNERFKQIKSIFPECETSFLVEKLQACNYDIEKVTRDLIDIGSYPTEPTSLREQHVDLTEIVFFLFPFFFFPFKIFYLLFHPSSFKHF